MLPSKRPKNFVFFALRQGARPRYAFGAIDKREVAGGDKAEKKAQSR
jgi:hypothetical protein